MENFRVEIQKINNIISNPIELKSIHDKWMSGGIRYVLSVFAPYQRSILKGLCSRGYIPLLLGKNKRLRLLDYIDCESHREKVVFALKK